MDSSFESYPHYFPKLERDESVRVLESTETGTFLIRPSSRESCLVISLKQPTKVLHLLLLKRGRGFGVDPEAWKQHKICDESFPTLELLVSRLKQLGLLKKGWTPNANNQSGDDLGAQGRDEMKKILDDKKEAERRLQENLEHEYKGLLESMIVQKSLDSDRLAFLAQWREKNHFSEEQHKKVIASLGYTEEQFEKLKDLKEKVSEKDACVVCLDAPKDAVFVACGHLATCTKCADRVVRCPVCQTPKTSFMRIFT